MGKITKTLGSVAQLGDPRFALIEGVGERYELLATST